MKKEVFKVKEPETWLQYDGWGCDVVLDNGLDTPVCTAWHPNKEDSRQQAMAICTLLNNSINYKTD